PSWRDARRTDRSVRPVLDEEEFGRNGRAQRGAYEDGTQDDSADPHLWSHPPGFDAQPRPFILVSEPDPVGQQRAGVARIDDLLDTEGFGGSERAAHGVQAPFDLRQQGRAIGSRVELAAVGGLDAPLERQRAPGTRRPGGTQVEGLDLG